MATGFQMDDEKYLYVPMSLLFVTLSENHEQISFAYPFELSGKTNCEDPLRFGAINRLNSISPERKKRTAEIHGLKPEILAHLLSGKGATDLPFELKIDNFRYVGYPKMVCFLLLLQKDAHPVSLMLCLLLMRTCLQIWLHHMKN